MNLKWSLKQLGYAKLPKINLPDTTYKVYRNKRDGGNVYMWNTSSLIDMPEALLCAFFVEDTRFKRLLKNTVVAQRYLERFEYVAQPDYSVYYDLPLMDQAYRCWVGNKTAKIWSDYNIKVVPNLVLGSKELFEFAVYGIAEGSDFIVQVQANDKNEKQDETDRWTIENAILRKRPNKVLVYGPPNRFQKLALDSFSCVERIESNIDYLRKFK